MTNDLYWILICLKSESKWAEFDNKKRRSWAVIVDIWEQLERPQIWLYYAYRSATKSLHNNVAGKQVGLPDLTEATKDTKILCQIKTEHENDMEGYAWCIGL